METSDAAAGGGGQLSENIPVAVDAGMPRDAAMDAGQDAAIDASQDGAAGASQDAATDASQDAAIDASQDAALDASQDAGVDASQDAGLDASQDAGTSAGQDAGADASQDASMDASQDASMDASQDASMDAGVDASMPACGGERVFGVCWYLAKASTSCNQECSNKGGFDTRSLQYVGTPNQGGSVEECTDILTALGKPAEVVAAMRSDSYGLGCHVWTNQNDNYWLVNPPFSPNTAAPSSTPVRIACGCMR